MVDDPQVTPYTLSPTPEPRPTTRRGRRSITKALARTQAYERFLEGMEIGEIAKTTGISRQWLYLLAKKEDWPGRRAKLQTHALLENGASVQALELAVAELQSKISVRLMELDTLCKKGHLGAIKLWLEAAGLRGKYEAPEGAKVVEVHNDLSDRRQVTIVQGETPNEAVEALPLMEEDPNAHHELRP